MATSVEQWAFNVCQAVQAAQHTAKHGHGRTPHGTAFQREPSELEEHPSKKLRTSAPAAPNDYQSKSDSSTASSHTIGRSYTSPPTVESHGNTASSHTIGRSYTSPPSVESDGSTASSHTIGRSYTSPPTVESDGSTASSHTIGRSYTSPPTVESDGSTASSRTLIFQKVRGCTQDAEDTSATLKDET
ncbi:unnamed protein product [Zymoseptoria tritici ST99CH_3D1]|nr:unnamed protein product [Zymoseptoria tritici ST99CH_3D1]